MMSRARLHNFPLKEIKEEWPVRTGFMSSVVLTIGEAALHQTVIHTREEVCAYAFIAKQFINRRCLRG